MCTKLDTGRFITGDDGQSMLEDRIHWKCKIPTMLPHLTDVDGEQDFPFPGQEALYEEISAKYLNWYTTGVPYTSHYDPITALVNRAKAANPSDNDKIASVLTKLFKIAEDESDSMSDWLLDYTINERFHTALKKTLECKINSVSKYTTRRRSVLYAQEQASWNCK